MGIDLQEIIDMGNEKSAQIQEGVPPHLIGVKMPDMLPIFPKLITGYAFDSADHYELKTFVKDYIEKNKNDGVSHDNGHNLTTWFNSSQQNFLNLEEPIVQKFKKFISESYETLNKVMHWDLKPDHFISECWINKTGFDGYQLRHSHSNCWISGTYYLDFPDGSSPIRFSQANKFESETPYFYVPPVEHNPFNSHFHDLMPKEGSLLLWASNIVHETLPNQSDSRISISMNIVPSEIDNGSYSVKLSK